MREYKAGDVIFKQGDDAHELYIVQSGKVQLFQGARVLETLSNDGIFGEMALIDSASRSATAVAITDAMLIPVSEDSFLSLIRNAPQFVLNVMRLLTRRLRERDRQYELMSADAIVGSIAHEIRQPLAAIATNAGAALRFLENKAPDYNEVRDALKRISTESHRASDVFDGIRALFKNVDAGRARIDINGIATEVLKSLRTELTAHGISVNSELTPGLPLVEGNRNQLHQVIFNLVQNAVEAMSATRDRSRVLQVRTERCGPDAIALGVQNLGPGIKAELLDRIFDAFITTKPSGMGLGLAICRTIVLHHDGQLTVSSDGEKGALFQLVLPVSTAEKSPVPLDEPLGSES